MTSRERVLEALDHRQPDKVPVDMSATPSSGISAIAYSNLLSYIKCADLPVRICDVVQQLAQPDLRILDMFDVDVIDIRRTFIDLPSGWYSIKMVNEAKAWYPIWFIISFLMSHLRI